MRRCAAALLASATALALMPTAPAGASVSTTSGQMERVAAPASVLQGKLTSATKIRVFDERQRFTLPAAQTVDLRAPGTYDQGGDLPPAGTVKIPAGTMVSSHMVHADAPGSPVLLDGTVTFADPIIGVITKSAGLEATDYLGAPGTAYQKGAGYRGFELGTDMVILPDQRTVRVVSTTLQAMDEMRVITQVPPLVTAGLSTNQSSIGAGVATVPVSNISGTALTASSNPDPVEAARLGAIRLGAIRLGAIDVAASRLGTIRLGAIRLGAIDVAASRLGTILLSDVPVDGGWALLLAGTQYAAVPLQTVTLGQVIGLPQVQDLTLSQIHLGATRLGAISVAALSLGSLQLADIPLTDAVIGGTATQRLQAWCDALGAAACASFGINPADPASAAGVTVASVSVAGGDLTSVRLGAIRLGAIDLAASRLGAIRLGTIRLGTIRLGAIRLGAIPVASRGTIVDCSAVDCNSTTLTLGALTPAQLLGTIGDLYALRGQSAELDAVLALVTFDEVFPGLVGPNDLPFETIDLKAAQLQNVASPLEPVLTYSAAITVAVTATLTVELTLPDGFVSTPGTAKLDGVATAPPTIAGRVLTLTLANVAPGSHTVALGARAGVDLGPALATLKVTATAGTESLQALSSAPVRVVESFEGNGAPNDFKVLNDGALYVSHISSATDTDFYRFDISAQQASAGASAQIFLGDLPADYDLTLYGPALAPASSSADEQQSSVADSGIGLQPRNESVAPDLANDIPVDPSRGTVVGIAANRGPRDEKIETGTLLPGTYWVQVSGYNGAFSNQPYVLRSRVAGGIVPPACTARQLPFTASASGALPDPNTYPSDLNTIFLVAQQRFTATFGPTRVAPVTTDLATVAGMAPDVVGRVVPVDGDPQVAAAYDAWASDRCSPIAAQKVADAIRAVVDRIRAARPSLRNVVVVGDDSVIPMGRVLDGTAISNERTYAETVNADTTNNELVGSIAGGFVLTDDVYGSPRVIDIENSQRVLYLPRLAVGRLVESPEDIAAALERFVASGGHLDPLTAAGSSSLVAGYDFLTDGANQVASELATKTTPRPPLINETWTRQNLVSSLLGTNPPSIASINAHFDQSRALPAAGNTTGSEADLFTVADVNSAGPGKLLGRLLFSMGCHSGLSVSDVAVGLPTPDWAQTLTGAGQGALWAGNTGFGYGDTELVAYSEKLMAHFADELAPGQTIGGALTAAKNTYKAETQPLSPYDEKVLQEVVLYGLPMYKPGGTTTAAATHAAAATASVVSGPPLSTEPITGLDVASVPLSLALSPTSGPGNLRPVDTGAGTYYEVDGKTIQVQYRPVQPLVTRPVTQPDGSGGLAQVAHGALITGLTSADLLGFSPYYSRPLVDLAAHEQLDQAVGDAVFPASILRVNSTVDGAGNDEQNLAVVPAQFRPNPATPGSGTERVLTGVQTLVHFTAPSDHDFTAPTILRSNASIVGGTVGFTVETDSTAKRVYVLFKTSGTSGSVTWQGVDLVRTPGTNRWTGGALTSSEELEFFVQAGDASGNWGMSDNKASNFLATKPPPPGGPLSIAVSGATKVGSWFKGPVNATVTNTGAGLVSTSVDGAAFTGYTGPVPVSGDGLHTVNAIDNLGNAVQAAVPIDTTGPTPVAVVTPGPGPNGWESGAATVTITPLDGGGSGVASITYTATGAQPIGSTTVNAASASFGITAGGVTTITFSAKDSAGNAGPTGTVTVQIDGSAPVVACGGASSAWSNTDVSIACTASDAQSGLENPADASFSLVTNVSAGTETATASTGSRTVCDVAGNCATGGPITGIQVDKKAPTIGITSPTSGAKLLLGSTGAKGIFSCTDSGSGMAGGFASCTATISGGAPFVSGTAIPTNVPGSFTMVVTGTDNAGNSATKSVTFSVQTYTVKLLYSSTTAVRRGSEIDIELSLRDAAGNNVTSSSIAVVATLIDGVTVPKPNTEESTNYGLAFRIEGSWYDYDLQTTGLSVGSHRLAFTVNGVSSPNYVAPFQLK